MLSERLFGKDWVMFVENEKVVKTVIRKIVHVFCQNSIQTPLAIDNCNLGESKW